jgi:hypothetical protein
MSPRPPAAASHVVVYALLFAVPIETVAFVCLWVSPTEMGSGTPLWMQAIGRFGIAMHYPAMAFSSPAIPVFVAAGYLTSTVLALVCILLWRTVRRSRQPH